MAESKQETKKLMSEEDIIGEIASNEAKRGPALAKRQKNRNLGKHKMSKTVEEECNKKLRGFNICIAELTELRKTLS